MILHPVEAKNTPLDSLKHAVLRATNSMSSATDAICGNLCNDDHDAELEWIDAIGLALWSVLAEHVPGITVTDGRVHMTPDARRAVHTYDDGSPVSVFINLDGYCTDFYPRFDGPYAPFLEELQRAAVVYKAEAIAYEAAHPSERPVDESEWP